MNSWSNIFNHLCHLYYIKRTCPNQVNWHNDSVSKGRRFLLCPLLGCPQAWAFSIFRLYVTQITLQVLDCQLPTFYPGDTFLPIHTAHQVQVETIWKKKRPAKNIIFANIYLYIYIYIYIWDKVVNTISIHIEFVTSTITMVKVIPHASSLIIARYIYIF